MYAAGKNSRPHIGCCTHTYIDRLLRATRTRGPGQSPQPSFSIRITCRRMRKTTEAMSQPSQYNERWERGHGLILLLVSIQGSKKTPSASESRGDCEILPALARYSTAKKVPSIMLCKMNPVRSRRRPIPIDAKKATLTLGLVRCRSQSPFSAGWQRTGPLACGSIPV